MSDGQPSDMAHGGAPTSDDMRDSQTSRAHADHPHAPAKDADSRYLTIALALLLGFMIIEVGVAVTSSSLALLADAGHMLAGGGAIAGSLWAIKLAKRAATTRWTFGPKRAEILAAAVNGLTLLVVGTLVLTESIQRLIFVTASGNRGVIFVREPDSRTWRSKHNSLKVDRNPLAACRAAHSLRGTPRHPGGLTTGVPGALIAR